MFNNFLYGWSKGCALGICFILLFFFTGCRPAPPERLELHIMIAKSPHSVKIPTYNLDESIECLVILENKMRTSVEVNKRLSIAYADYPFKEIFFVILDPAGNPVKFKDIFIHGGPPLKRDFQELKPGEHVSTIHDLSMWYTFDKKGEYSIQAIYENQSEPEGITAWKGKLESNKVKILIR